MRVCNLVCFFFVFQLNTPYKVTSFFNQPNCIAFTVRADDIRNVLIFLPFFPIEKKKGQFELQHFYLSSQKKSGSHEVLKKEMKHTHTYARAHNTTMRVYGLSEYEYMYAYTYISYW